MTLKEKIAALRAKIAAKSKETEGFSTKEAHSADDLKTLKDATAELNTFSAELDVLLETQKALGATRAVPALEDGETVHAQVKTKLSTEEKISAAICGLLKSNADPSKNAYAHMDEMGYGTIAKEFEAARVKAPMQAGVAAQGGILVPIDMANEIVEILRPNTTILQVPGLRRIPMPNGNYELPAGATGATANYQGEVAHAGVTQQTFRDVKLTARTLSAIIPVTNDLLNFSISGAMSFVQTDLRAALSQKMDASLWRSTGGVNQPTGIMKIPGIGTRADGNTNAPTYTQIDAAARVLIVAMQNSYIPETNWAWVMPKRVIGYLQDLRTSNGNPVYPGMQLPEGQKRFKGYPVLETTNFPLTLNTRGSSDDTEIALVAGDQVLFGESMPLELAVSSEATIVNGSTVTSMFQARQTAVLAVMQHDINVRQIGAVQVLTGVRWGA